MRFSASNSVLKARAIAGTHVVVLAWDFMAAVRQQRLAGLLGFAVERSELAADGTVLETYWLRGIKRFRDKDKGLPAGTPVPSAEHPIQTFQWGDYTAKAARRYRYRIVPAYGQPKKLVLDNAAALVLLALGVPRETVMQDYLLTNEVFKPPWAPRPGMPPEVMQALWGVQAEYLDAALEMIDREHGGPERYLKRVIGLDAERLARLAARYLQPEPG